MAFEISTKTTNSSVEQRNSRYVQGGTTDKYKNRIGWFERRVIERRDDDITVIIRKTEEHRPDLLSYRIYGKSNLMWLVLQYNNIIDIETEFLTDKEIILPNPRRVLLDILNQPTGGNVV